MQFCGANKKHTNLQFTPNLHRFQGTGYDFRSFPSFSDRRIFSSVFLSRQLVPAFSRAKGLETGFNDVRRRLNGPAEVLIGQEGIKTRGIKKQNSHIIRSNMGKGWLDLLLQAYPEKASKKQFLEAGAAI